MLRYFISCAFICACFLVNGQLLTIIDQETKLPVEAVTFISENPYAFAITNEKGKIDIAVFSKTEKIEIRALGYKSIVKTYQNLIDLNGSLILEPSNLNLDAIVISGTRWRQSSNHIPAKIISISKQNVNLLNPQTAADLLSISGKVYVQKSQQGGGSPMIRGFATNRLLYTVDGVRMNNAIFRSGNIQNVINLDPFATERTEVLFGPGSVIYGSDAIGGVMSFQTLTPELSLTEKPKVKANLALRYASANQEKTGHADIQIGWKKWAFLTSASSWDYDHLRQGSNGPDDYLKSVYVDRISGKDSIIIQSNPLLQIPSAYSQVNFMQKIRFKPNENWDIQYGYHYSNTSPYGRYDRHNRTRNNLPRYAEWNYGPQKWQMNNLNVTHEKSNNFFDQMTFRGAWQTFEESRIDRNLNNNSRNITSEKVQAYSANIDFNKSIGENHTLFYGFEYVLNQVTSTGKVENISSLVTTQGAARYPNSNWSSIAVYLNDEYRVSEKIALQTGLRYSHFILDADFSNNLEFYPFPFQTIKINDGSLSGSIGGVYRPIESFVISSNFGSGFRSPNVDDIGKIFDSEPGAIVVPNPNLKAEYAYNADFGVAKIFGDAVKVDISLYYTYLQNAMVRRNFTFNGQDSILYGGELSQVQAIQNAAFAFVYGVQTGLEIQLPKGFNISSDINYQKGQEVIDDGTKSPLKHAAPIFGSTRLNYKYKTFKIQFYANYQAKLSNDNLANEEQAKNEIYAKDENGKNYSPAWYTLNIKALYDIKQHFLVSLGIENITDQRYRSYSSGISGAGRNLVLGLNYKF